VEDDVDVDVDIARDEDEGYDDDIAGLCDHRDDDEYGRRRRRLAHDAIPSFSFPSDG
jgi:hypothetical protein